MKRLIGLSLFFVGVLILFTSCAKVTPTLLQQMYTPTPSIFAPTSTVTPKNKPVLETANPSEPVKIWISPTQSPTSTQTEVPTPSPTYDAGVSAPEGLTYCYEDLLWYVSSESQAISLAPCDAKISPDGRYAAYIRNFPVFDLWYIDLTTGRDINLTRTSENDIDGPYRSLGIWSQDNQSIYYTEGSDYWFQDIWVVDIANGIIRNLTNTPDRDETMPEYWPYSNRILFYSHSKDEDPAPNSSGYLTTIRPDGSGYRILSDDFRSFWYLSPDGRYLASRGGDLYEWETGSRKLEFNLKNYPPSDTVHLIAPSWSPDNKTIAWSIDIEDEKNYTDAIGLLDLESSDLLILHPFHISMGEGFPPAPQWSPDGQWLTLDAYDENPDKAGLWFIRKDGTQEHNLGHYNISAWSPDSQWLVVSGSSEASDGSEWIMCVGEWDLRRLVIPDGAQVLRWINPDSGRKWVNMTFVHPFADLGRIFTITKAGNNLNIHEQPSLSARVIGQLKVGDNFVFIKGPEFSDRYAWYELQVDSSGLEGWVVENHTWFEPQH